MVKTLTFIRHNAIALLALFVALSGTSYAAFSLPAGSVGQRQLKDRAVTPRKLDPASVAATIRAWAFFQWTGGGWKVRASTPDIGIHQVGTAEWVVWRHTRFAANCMPFVSVSTDVAFDLPGGLVQIGGIAGPNGPDVAGIQLVVVCPSPGSQRVNKTINR